MVQSLETRQTHANPRHVYGRGACDFLLRVLRGGDQLQRQVAEREVDLLIPPDQLPQLRTLLARLGFVRLRAWGHEPHHFFVTYDTDSDKWLKLDIVTRVAYGRPAHALSSRLAVGCLRNRRRCGAVYVPAPEDELVTLLLHCVLDKNDFPQHWQRRLQSLGREIGDERYLSELLAEYWPPEMTWQKLSLLIDAGRWETLLDCRPRLVKRLAAADRAGTLLRRLRDRALRKANRLAGLLRPGALSVALLAPDGAGKSTLAEGVMKQYYFPVRQIYMGLYQQQRKSTTSRRIPGVAFIGKLLMQWRRYLAARYHRRCGRLVIFDRYIYDSLLPRPDLGRLSRFRRWLLAHACPAPDLILMLDAPGEILYARKGEHTAQRLERQRRQYLDMQRRLPRMVVVDATRDADQVRREVISRIWRTYAGRHNSHERNAP